MRIHRSSAIVFMTPAIVLILMIFFYPVLRTLFMSFFQVKGVNSPISTWTFAGIKNYTSLFNTRIFLISLGNIAKLWLYCGIATMLISLLMSVILTSGIKLQKFFRAVVYMPNIIAAIAVGYMWLLYVFNSNFGLLATVFRWLGLEHMANFQWLASDHIFLAMSFAYIFGNVGYYMLMFIAGIEKIPTDYYEAATIEGANIFVKFSKITIPLLKPVLSTALVLWTTRTMGFFALSQVFSGVNTYTPMVFTYDALFGSEISADSISAGIAAASAVSMTAIVLVVSGITKRFFPDEGYDL